MANQIVRREVHRGDGIVLLRVTDDVWKMDQRVSAQMWDNIPDDAREQLWREVEREHTRTRPRGAR